MSGKDTTSSVQVSSTTNPEPSSPSSSAGRLLLLSQPPTPTPAPAPPPPPNPTEGTTTADAIISSAAEDPPPSPPLQAQRDSRLRRGLAERHLSMMGVAGAIGTGLFLGLGAAVRAGGPLGALLGYATVGLVVCAVQVALGEAGALFPATGAFVRHAETLVDPAWGFAVGWNLVYGNLLSIPSEMAAVCVLVEFWMPGGGGSSSSGSSNSSGYSNNNNISVAVIIAFIILTLIVGFSLVRVVGEVEYVCALLKILLVVVLIIFGLVIDLGGIPGTPPLYFRYWRAPYGPFAATSPFPSSPSSPSSPQLTTPGNWDRFLGYWSVMTSAVFAFSGVESIAMAAAETHNPRRAIPAACRAVFLRVLLFYGLSIFVVGLLVASNDPRLADSSSSSGSTAAQSPFVIAAQAAHLSASSSTALASTVNAVLILSAWSSANQALLAGSRVLYGLALDGQAPALFLRTTRWGAPWACVALFALFMLLAFTSLSRGAVVAFGWLVSLTAAGVLVSWIAILANHIRLRLALRAQNIPARRLPWYSGRATLASSCCALLFCCLLLLTAGFQVFIPGNWSAQTFVAAYLDIPLVLAAFLIYKFTKKTKMVKLTDIPLSRALQQSDDKHLPIGDQAR